MTGLNLSYITVPNSKLKAQVASEYAPQFQAFINAIAPYYQINSLGGYANRANVNSPNVKSHHAHGWAIDMNPATNPNIRNAGPLAQRMKNRSKYTDMPMWMSDIAQLFGLGWGGNWKNISDAMHFSVAKNEGGRKLARLPTDAEVAAVFKKHGVDWKGSNAVNTLQSIPVNVENISTPSYRSLPINDSLFKLNLVDFSNSQSNLNTTNLFKDFMSNPTQVSNQPQSLDLLPELKLNTIRI